jgi:hypothetical protein
MLVAPVLVPAVLLAVLLADPPPPGMAAELFRSLCAAALIMSVLTAANLTAFLVDEERRRAGSRLLRLAGLDGLNVVAAHLVHAAAVGAAGVVAGSILPGLDGLAKGMPPSLWLRTLLLAGLCASIGGVIGLWLGYFRPRVVAVVAVQVAGFWVAAALSGTVLERPVAVGEPLSLLAAAHVSTLVVLPRRWRLTSRRHW